MFVSCIGLLKLRNPIWLLYRVVLGSTIAADFTVAAGCVGLVDHLEFRGLVCAKGFGL